MLEGLCTTDQCLHLLLYWPDIDFGWVTHLTGIFLGCRGEKASTEGSGKPWRHVALEIEGSEVFKGLEGNQSSRYPGQ